MICLLRNRIRTARTPKSCHGCGLAILPGDRYADTVYAEDGRAYSWPEHAECYEERMRLDGSPEYRADDGYPFASLTEYYVPEDLSPEYRAWLAAREAQR